VTRAEAEALLANPDLIAIGMKGEEARKAQTGERVTYGRVLVVNVLPASRTRVRPARFAFSDGPHRSTRRSRESARRGLWPESCR
jgi:hypothetical protein